MAENNRQQGNTDSSRGRQDNSMGNQQQTAQTGSQNGGGENIDQQEDQFTEDLRQSGDRNSSNRKTES
jgi:hypothetical protein